MTKQSRVICDVCLKHVSKLDALVAEGRTHVSYFCGYRCYQHWLGEHARRPRAQLQQSPA